MLPERSPDEISGVAERLLATRGAPTPSAFVT